MKVVKILVLSLSILSSPAFVMEEKLDEVMLFDHEPKTCMQRIKEDAFHKASVAGQVGLTMVKETPRAVAACATGTVCACAGCVVGTLAIPLTPCMILGGTAMTVHGAPLGEGETKCQRHALFCGMMTCGSLVIAPFVPLAGAALGGLWGFG